MKSFKLPPILIFVLSVIFFGNLILNPSIAQTINAGLLNNGVQQFFDNSGNPLTSGKVYFYEVDTSTFKDTYTSSDGSTINQNPITLNAGGKAPTGGIYGVGLYRQVLKDRNGNLIWDAVTSPGGNGGVTPTLVGDGNLVGTVLPWSGLVAPNQYVFAYGQEIARATYPDFFTAVTQQVNVICSASSNILTGIADTSQINLGSPIELSLCVIAGTTVVGKTASTVTLSNPSTVSINAVATFFPYGDGNGATTFNVPDLRGLVIAGRDNMGGSAAGRLSNPYFSLTISPDALGAIGGSQSHILSQSELSVALGTATSVVIDPGHSHGFLFGGSGAGHASGPGAGASGDITNVATTGITVTTTISNANGGNPHSIVQPTITLNYVIKITPDISTSIATGVYSIGGMTGVISCGTGILCTGNIISFNASTFASGLTNYVQYNNAGQFAASPNFQFISPDNLTLGAAGVTGKFDIFGSSTGKVRQIAQAAAGTPTIIWGTSSGTPAVTASLPVVLNATTGNLSCPTCATSTLNGQALTESNDTNVTLTLGGSPTTALLSPASLTLGWTGTLAAGRLNSNVVQSVTNDTNITGTISVQNLILGWSGQLAVGRGGTGLGSGTNGGVPYFNSASTMASSALLTANQIMIGGGAGAAPTTFACATTTTVIHGGTPPTCSQIVAADVTTNTITNSNLSQTGAASFKGNPTASLANAQDFTVQGLSNLASPSATLDFIPIYDHATGLIKNVTPGAIAGSVVAGVASVNTLVGSLTLNANSGLNIVSAGTTITITPDIATTANFEAGTSQKLLDANVVFSPEVTITYGTTTGISGSNLINGAVTLTGNITTLNCSGFKASQAGVIRFIQDSTGSRTAAFNTGSCSTLFKFAGATFPTLTTSPSAVDVLSYNCSTSSYCAAGLSKGYNP